ncbi:hypothetical protein ACLOJK_002194, partial [Asimina triloba]
MDKGLKNERGKWGLDDVVSDLKGLCTPTRHVLEDPDRRLVGRTHSMPENVSCWLCSQHFFFLLHQQVAHMPLRYGCKEQLQFYKPSGQEYKCVE